MQLKTRSTVMTKVWTLQSLSNWGKIYGKVNVFSMCDRNKKGLYFCVFTTEETDKNWDVNMLTVYFEISLYFKS